MTQFHPNPRAYLAVLNVAEIIFDRIVSEGHEISDGFDEYKSIIRELKTTKKFDRDLFTRCNKIYDEADVTKLTRAFRQVMWWLSSFDDDEVESATKYLYSCAKILDSSDEDAAEAMIDMLVSQQ